jgi:hypothetical protein
MARQSDDARVQNPKLRERLPTLVPRILKDRDHRIGEQNTKAMLIEPILEALGWDIRDWDEVHREFRAKSGDSPVDYALKIMRTPRLFLEAKGLGEDLSDRKWVAQVLGYATVAGVEWCVLTDGDEWRFYNSTAAVDAEEKLFRRVRLSDGNHDEALETLSLLARDNIEGNLLEPLWAAHFVDRKVKEALLQMLESRDAGIVRLIRRKAPKLKPKQVVESLGRLEVRIDSPAVRPTVAVKPASSEPRRGTPSPKPSTGRKPKAKDGLADLITANVLKAPLRLFSRYRKQLLEAMLLPTGEVEFQGQRYASPSAAGGAAKATITGRKMSTDGWSFWQVEGKDGKTRTLDEVRDSYLKRED